METKIKISILEYRNLIQLYHFINLQLKNESIKVENKYQQIRLNEITETIQKDINNLTLKNK